MPNTDKSKKLAVSILYALLLIESIAVISLLIFTYTHKGNMLISIVFFTVLVFFVAAGLLLKYKKYDAAKFIIVIVPSYAVLAISIIEKHFKLFDNIYSFLNPRFFEIIHLMVPVIVFGLIQKRKMIISLIVILPTAVLFSPIHYIFGIDTDVYITNKDFYSLFTVMFTFFYSVAVISVLFFQKTSLLYSEKIKHQRDEIIKEKEELLEIKKRLELAQKAGKIGVWDWNVKENKIFWTDTAYEIFGIEKKSETLNVDIFFKIVYKDDIKRLENELNFALKNNIKNLKTNYRIIKNGEIRHIEEISEIIKNEKGEFIKMTGVLQDVTDKVLAQKQLKEKNEELSAIEEELRQSNEELKAVKDEIEKQYEILLETTEKYQLLSDNITDLIWMISFDLEILYVSQSCEKFIGYTIDEIKDMSLSDIHTEKSYKLIKKLIKATKNKKNKALNSTTKAEIEYIHKNGNIILAEISGNIIYKNGKAIGIGGVSRDITDRKKTEKALLESNKKIINLHNDLLENIKYAKKIQDALLTRKEIIDSIFKEYFLTFSPRYTVGGDFYYVIKIKKYIVVAVGDCTGHGISGGFLTMTALTYLHETVSNKMVNNPAQVLEILRKKIKRTYRNFGKDSANAFNISLCVINTETNIMNFAGAYHSLFVVRDKKELTEYKATRNPIGFYYKETEFADTVINLKKEDKIYLFSDGYYDQINNDGVKIGKKRFKQLLSETANLSLKSQQNKLNEYFFNWKNEQNQIDDVTILGIKWTA